MNLKASVTFIIMLVAVTAMSSAGPGKLKSWKELKEKLSTKYQTLIDRSSDIGGLMERWSTEEFINFFVNSPRNYSGIVLFNTHHPDCEKCQLALRNLRYVAVSYKKSFTVSSRNEKQSERLFFLEVLEENHEILRMVGLGTTNLPVLFHFPSDGTLEGLDELNLNDTGDHGQMEAIMIWIRRVTGIQIILDRNFTEDEPMESFAMKYIAVALVITHFYKQRLLILNLLINQTSTAVAVGSIITLCYLTSGHTFNWINSVQLFGQSVAGIHFIHPETNSQFGIETFFVFVLYCLTTASIIALIEIRKQSQNNWSNWITLGSLITILTTFNLMHAIYRVKMNQ